ncbi:MAG TPA: class I SAM-dependent methyltransferase [Verrucomicrobiota bacterium]|jgi:SAM-dependent methyltransferase|nr:class I SAM-dependent methyltransferase [Verrucomicrobiota bacterium]HQL79612.1 class I SAM-dependent methyltransferase [Verrucomicrobiota bacterium]
MANSPEAFLIEEDPFYVADLLQMSKAERYRRWQFDVVAPFVRGKVLEVGGGIGNFTPELAGVAKWVTSIEPNAYCHARLLEKTKVLPNVQVLNVTVEALDNQVSAADAFDTIILMNVLEHIKDDEGVLRRLKQRLARGGRVVVLVPAGPWAFGSTDVRLGHYRRYSRKSARDLMAKLNLEVEKLRYYNFIGVWAWWWNAKVTRRQSQRDAQIRVFDRLFVPMISRIEKMLPPPLGQSVLIVGRQTQS